MSVGVQVVVGILAVMILVQLATGITFGGGESEHGLRRSEQPQAYWIRVMMQVVLAVVVIVAFNADWAKETASKLNEKVDSIKAARTAATPSPRESESAPSRESASRPAFVSSHQKVVAAAYQLAQQGNNGPAAAMFGQLIANADTSAYVRYSRAMAYWKMNKMDSALIDFRRVAELAPDDYGARVGIDRVLAPRGRWDEILASWNEYLALKPDDAKAFYERGGTNYRMGNRAAAIKDAEKACQLGLAEACSRAASLRP